MLLCPFANGGGSSGTEPSDNDPRPRWPPAARAGDLGKNACRFKHNWVLLPSGRFQGSHRELFPTRLEGSTRDVLGETLAGFVEKGGSLRLHRSTPSVRISSIRGVRSS